jgi:hypothetical protein
VPFDRLSIGTGASASQFRFCQFGAKTGLLNDFAFQCSKYATKTASAVGKELLSLVKKGLPNACFSHSEAKTGASMANPADFHVRLAGINDIREAGRQFRA